jgi:predicted esterase
LLHGLGDSDAPFARFARAMQLPETAALAVRGTSALPFDLDGFHWGDDVVVDQANGDLDSDTGFKRSMQLVCHGLIKETLMAKCNFKPRQIVLFGFGQGGMLALSIAAELDQELGGTISIGGELPASSPVPELGKTSKTPVLICRAKHNSAVSDKGIARLKDTFASVAVREFAQSHDAMPSNRDEMLPIMQFFGRRLLSLKGIPKESIPLS